MRGGNHRADAGPGTIGVMSDLGPAPRTVVVDGRTFERVPSRAPVLMPGDDMAGVIQEHAGAFLRPGDTVVMSGVGRRDHAGARP